MVLKAKKKKRLFKSNHLCVLSLGRPPELISLANFWKKICPGSGKKTENSPPKNRCLRRSEPPWSRVTLTKHWGLSVPKSLMRTYGGRRGKGRGTPLLGCFEKCSAIICSLSRVYKINLGLFAGFVKASGLVRNWTSLTSNAQIAYRSKKVGVKNAMSFVKK